MRLPDKGFPVGGSEDIESFRVGHDNHSGDLGVPVELLRGLESHVLEHKLGGELRKLWVACSHSCLLLGVSLDGELPKGDLWEKVFEIALFGNV